MSPRLEALTFAAALALTLAATPVVRRLALRVGATAAVRGDRWHVAATPNVGGVAIVLGCLAAAHLPLALVACSFAMFVLGFVDDRIQLRPRQKLCGQVAIASIYLWLEPVAAWPLALLFIVFVTNAMNLLDHIDGLSSGAAAIASASFGHAFASAGRPMEALFAWAIAGASLGFFLWNVHPASLFMGDGGSLFLGFALAALAVRHATLPIHPIPAFFAPLAFLAIPLLDTTLVIVSRTAAGRPITEGGRDHSSHRLVRLGVPQRTATATLHGVGVAVALVGTALLHASPLVAAILCASVLAPLALLGSYLLQAAHERERSRVGYFLRGAWARRARRLVADALLVTVAYAAAVAIRFEGDVPVATLAAHARAAIVVIPTQVVVLHLASGARASWRHAAALDVGRALAGSLVAVAVSAVVLVSPSLSRGVFLIDAALLALAATTAIVARPAFHELWTARFASGPGAIVVARRTTVASVAESLRVHGPRALAFVVDDPDAVGPSVAGVPVVGGVHELAAILERHGASDVAVAMDVDDAETLTTLCGRDGRRVYRLLPTCVVATRPPARSTVATAGS